MNAWAEQQKLIKVKVLPDGNADFTRQMGMLVEKKHVGFGQRSWRYCAIINDGVVENGGKSKELTISAMIQILM